jgi:hypothetical protein
MMNSAKIFSRKNSMDRNIDCIIWYIKNGLTVFLRIAAIISQIKPAPPAVK